GARFGEEAAVDAGMQRLYTAIEHFRKRCETRDLAHRNFFFPQQDRCPTCGNDIYTLALQRAGKRGDTGFVRNGNERAADFHADVNRDSLNRYINSRLTNYDPRKPSAIEKDIPGRRIQNRAAADGFAKCFAEMTQTRVAHFCRGFSDIVASSAQELRGAFHPHIAQILRNSETDLA